MEPVSHEKRYGLKTLAVTLLCLGGAGTSAYLLYNDFNQAGGAGKGKPIAYVQRREAKVRRKASSTYVWTNVQNEEALFRKDYLQTNAGSAVAIRFEDGAVLELAENSLIVIDDITNLSLNFVKGQIVLHTAQGDSRVTAGADGKAKFEELPVRLLKPEPLFRYYTAEKQPKAVTFAWKSRNAQQGLPEGSQVQISSSRSFSPSKTQLITLTDSKSFETQGTLGAGTWFWRLVSPDSNGGAVKALTEISQFRVVEAAPLKPLLPSAGEKILSYGDGAPTPFRWQERIEGKDDNASGIEHVLEVARDPEFKSILVTRVIAPSSGLANLTGLTAGDLYWRVRSTYADLRVASNTLKFSFGQIQKPNLDLALPEERKSIESAAVLRFVWNSDAPDLEYLWEVQDGKGQVVQTAPKSRANGAAWKRPPAGSYKWRVTAFMKGHEVSQSPWRALTVFEGAPIALQSPVKNQELYYWEAPTTFDFKWAPDPLVQKPEYSYRVEISSDLDFKSPQLGAPTKQTQLSRESMKVGPGSYLWRVSVVDASGEAIKTSKPERFVYGQFPLLRAPEVTFPATEAVFKLIEKDEVPRTAWAAVPGATAYELVVTVIPDPATAKRSPASASPKIVTQETLTATEFTFKGLKPGQYAWTVRAIDQAKRRGNPLPTQRFTVTYGATLTSPEVLSPEVQ